ncbi:hypothetical protein EGW08_022938 [Elysia chlorotica]|uniref:Uncharacterized protein n=1 Tax=Elysia chlorotica TaxID=188477 RepID=A0A3S1BKI3_ELYCH|nr:hypothetical protein EGW08_022938 [Elysia chlorotica]
MSFLKFWSSKKSGSKKDDSDAKSGDASQEPDLEKRRLRHSLSISRSGRFKQRKRERSQILDRPEIFDCHDCPHGEVQTASSSSSSSLASQTQGESDSLRAAEKSSAGGHFISAAASSSPKFGCRSVAPPGGLRMGRPMLT